MDALLAKLADSVLSKASDSAVGWVTNEIFGGSSGGDQQKIEQQIAAQQQELTAISSQISALSTQISSFEQAYFTASEQQEYDLLIAAIANDIATLQTSSAALNQMQQLPLGSTLNGDQKTALFNIRTQMPTVIAHLNQVLDPSSPGANGAVQAWSTIAFRHQGFFNPSMTLTNSIYVSDYTDSAFNQIDYFAGLMVQALNIMSEAYHISFNYNGETYPVDTSTVQCYTQWVQSFLASWRAIPAQGLQRLAPTVLADTRNHRMWSRTWITLPMNPPETLVCWSQNCGNGSLQQPGLQTYVASLSLGGFSDWRLPTNAEWQGLLTGDGTNSGQTWLNAQGIEGDLDGINAGGVYYSQPLWSMNGSSPNQLTLNMVYTGGQYGALYFADAHQCQGLTGDGMCPSVPFVVRTMP